jgi:hypothetical protein
MLMFSSAVLPYNRSTWQYDTPPTVTLLLMADLINGFPAKPAAGSAASCAQAIGPAADAVVGTTDAAVKVRAIALNNWVVSAANALRMSLSPFVTPSD